MLMWILCAVSLALALNPGRTTLSGRVAALFAFLSCLTYGFFMAQGGRYSELGSLAGYVSMRADPLGAQGVTAILLVILAAYLSWSHRHVGFDRSTPATTMTVQPLHVALLSVYAIAAAIYIIWTIGPDTLLAYRSYGSIKDLNETYIDSPVGLLIASSFRLVIIVTIFGAIVAFANRHYGAALFALIPIALAFAIGVAEASRILSVYCALAAIGLHLIGKRLLAVGAAVGVLVFAGFVLEARAHSSLGLAYFPEYLLASLSEPLGIWALISNAFSGLLLTNASIERAVPGAYDFAYKILSFLPTVSAIDGFQAVNELEQQRVALVIPFNAFGEAWAFGPLYYGYLWLLLFTSAYCVNSSRRFGNAPFLLMLGAFVLGLMLASQYPIRNAARYFYLLILLRLAIGSVFGRLARRKVEPAPSPHGLRRGVPYP